VEDNIEQRTVNLQSVFAVIDKAQLSEPVHEKANSGPGCAYHIGESLLTDPGDDHLRHAFLAEMSQQEQNPSESLFAGIEELVD